MPLRGSTQQNTKMKHTQEWIANWDKFGGQVVKVKNTGERICEVMGGAMTDEAVKTAKMLSATPELLAFALRFSEQLASGKIDVLKAKTGHEKEVADMVRLNIKAIEKATQ